MQEGISAPSRINDLALLIGRLLVAALFFPSAFDKIRIFGAFTASLSRTFPHPELWAVAAIALEIGAGVALVLGVLPRWTALALVGFTIIATWIAHRFWMFDGPVRRQQEIHFYKNLAITGGLCFYFVAGAGRWKWRRASPT